MISVVIPYYQRESGILGRALASIAAQRDCPMPIHVIVVDDASPIPADAEIEAAGNLPYTVTVVKQPNGGPGSARNAALNAAPKNTRFVAFLDSDDEWSVYHLARAASSLNAGYDFFFADHHQLNQTAGAFERAGRIQPSMHPALPTTQSDLHAYQGDMFDQIIRGNVIGTSTVVYDFHKFNKNRFKVEFTNAGEDYLFWMEIASRNAKIAFSSQSEAKYGKGVNVYSGAGWGSDQHLLRVYNELKFKKITKKLYPLTVEQKGHISASVRALRIAFSRDLLHRISHRKSLSIKLLFSQLILDPLSYFVLLNTFKNLILKHE